jgi:hypothetical protein
MRVLRAIVESRANLVPTSCADFIQPRRISSEKRYIFFMIRSTSFSAAALSRLAVTTASLMIDCAKGNRTCR